MALLGGLTSRTFYPLMLAFALCNIPLRYLPYTIPLYATFVDGAVNIAPSLYGWYGDHFSSNWMFWNSALITPLMMICIYCGIRLPLREILSKSAVPTWTEADHERSNLTSRGRSFSAHLVG